MCVYLVLAVLRGACRVGPMVEAIESLYMVVIEMVGLNLIWEVSCGCSNLRL